MKKCPFCAEEIQDEAIKCKHCGEMMKQLLGASKNPEIKIRSSINDGVRLGVGMFIKLPLMIIGIALGLVIIFGILRSLINEPVEISTPYKSCLKECFERNPDFSIHACESICAITTAEK